MKKKWPFIVVGVLLLFGMIGSFLVQRHLDTNLVEIVQDGQVLHRLDLTQTENQTIEVEYDGRVNTVEIKNHQIHMLEAECPDKTCVNMGWLNSAAPIVCLPNHLVIQFTDIPENIDAAVQ